MTRRSGSLQSSFWLMILLQTIGSVDMPGSGDRKMPAPRAYLATVVVWSVLQIAADAGLRRAAQAMAWLTVLAGLVLGPAGKKLVGLFTGVANIYKQPDSTTFTTPPGFSPLSPTFPAQTP